MKLKYINKKNNNYVFRNDIKLTNNNSKNN